MLAAARSLETSQKHAEAVKAYEQVLRLAPIVAGALAVLAAVCVARRDEPRQGRLEVRRVALDRLLHRARHGGQRRQVEDDVRARRFPAVTLALDRALPALVEEITEKVLIALGE